MKNKFLFKILITFFVIILISCPAPTRDNPNDPKSEDYTITATVSPSSSTTITGNQSIVITFSDEMNPASLSTGDDLDGDLAAAEWSNTNKTLTLSPTTIWSTEGNQSITVDADSIYGISIGQLSYTFDVFHGFFVRNTNAGDDYPAGDDNTMDGSINSPYSTIQAAIDDAKTTYGTGAIRVAEGTYTSNYSDANNPVINMTEGISVYGGYNTSFTTRDSDTYTTTLEDLSTSGGGSFTDTNITVKIDNTISNTTVIDGFEIKLGQGTYNSAIFCEGDVIIENNSIIGLTQSEADNSTNAVQQVGINIYGADANPTIRNNDINSGWNKYSSNGNSYGIYINASTSNINNNTISGGSGYTTYALYALNTLEFTIDSNTIDGGAATNTAYCIFIRNSHPNINSNIFNKNIGATNVIHGIYEFLNQADPTSLTLNDFNYQGNWYYDFSNNQIDDSFYSTREVTIVDGDDVDTDPDSGLLFNSTWGNYSTSENLP